MRTAAIVGLVFLVFALCARDVHKKVKGKWCYLYRAIDRDGNLVD
jgi:hypothetical protein